MRKYLPALRPSANTANTPGGTNYAIGGALDNSILGPGNENLFAALSGPNPNLPSTVRQIRNYLAAVNGQANPNALYLIGSGANDAFVAEQLFPAKDKVTAFLVGEAGALVNSISQLKATGARYIVVTDEYVPPSADATAVAYVRTLGAATWGGLAAAGVNFIPADTLSVIAAVEQNPLDFGVTAPIDFERVRQAHSVSPRQGLWVSLRPDDEAAACGDGLWVFGFGGCDADTLIHGWHTSHASGPGDRRRLYLQPARCPERNVVPRRNRNPDGFPDDRRHPAADCSRRTLPWTRLERVDERRPFLSEVDNSSNGFPNDPGLPVSGTAGVDYKWSNGWLVGAAVTLGFVNPTFSLGGGYTQDAGSVSFYTGYRNYDVWGDLVGTVGLLHDTTNREIPIGITVQPNNASTTGLDLSLAGEVGYDFHAGLVTHGPLAGFILQQARINGFTESGSFTSLSFATQMRNSEVSALGYQARLDWGILHPFAQVVWDHEFDPLNRVVTASLTTTSAPSYSLPAVVLGRDWATTTVGTNVTFDRSWSGIASFTAQLGQNHALVYGGLVGFDYSFGQQLPAPVLFRK